MNLLYKLQILIGQLINKENEIILKRIITY